MDSLKDKRILILEQRTWGARIGFMLAKRLHAEGAKLAALTLKRSTHKFILDQKEVPFELVINNDQVMEEPGKYLAGDEYTLEQICDDLGIDSIWSLVMSLRNYVRSYKDKYYYSFKQNVSDEQIIEYVKGIYKYIKKIFNDFNPDLIIAPNFVALPHMMLNLYAKKNGVAMTAVTDCKVRGVYIFSRDYEDKSGSFYDRVKQLNAGEKSDNAERAKKYIAEFRQKFIQPDYVKQDSKKKSIKELIKDEIRPFYHIFKWYTRPQVNFLKTVGITLDYKPPKYILRDHYANKRYRRYMNNFKYADFSQIKKYVYFPLQFQPEATIDVIAPYFSNQIETARLVAMSLPDDYVLVVREHPAMVGLRPPSYIEKIARTLNIKLIDYRIPNEDVIKGADLIVSPNSTTVAEAAYLNKQAIQLGNLGTTLLLPNTTKHTDLTTLSSKIKEVLNKEVDQEVYERQLENYVAAAYDTGFELDYMSAWERGRQDQLDDLWQKYRQEIISCLENNG